MAIARRPGAYGALYGSVGRCNGKAGCFLTVKGHELAGRRSSISRIVVESPTHVVRSNELEDHFHGEEAIASFDFDCTGQERTVVVDEFQYNPQQAWAEEGSRGESGRRPYAAVFFALVRSD
ncbi:hypothetical protein ABZV67_20640 [Streptomyces sp. NPDC005065]|uniref:hypothetical protein n=1 Tax=Streptomyces sp. NPDC005065 TaxID=3154461 RepID=UPI0033B3E24E